MTQIFLTDSDETYGQQQEQLLKRAHGLRDLGFEARIICPTGSPLYEAAKSQWLGLDSLSINPTLAVPSVLKLSHLIRKHRPLAVWCHGEYDAYLSASAVHGLHGLGFIGNRPALLRIRLNQTGSTRALLVNKAFDQTLVASEELRDRLLDNPYIDPGRVGVLPPIVDGSQLRSSEGEGVKGLNPALAQAHVDGLYFIGVWADQSQAFDFLFLVQLLAELVADPAIEEKGFVCLIGGVEPNPMAEALIERFNLTGQVHFMGQCQTGDDWFNHLDVMLAPTAGNSPQQALLKAVALQVPVLTSRVPARTYTPGLEALVQQCPYWHQPKAQERWLRALKHTLGSSVPNGSTDAASQALLDQMGVRAHLEALLGPFQYKSLGRS